MIVAEYYGCMLDVCVSICLSILANKMGGIYCCLYIYVTNSHTTLSWADLFDLNECYVT